MTQRKRKQSLSLTERDKQKWTEDETAQLKNLYEAGVTDAVTIQREYFPEFSTKLITQKLKYIRGLHNFGIFFSSKFFVINH